MPMSAAARSRSRTLCLCGMLAVAGIAAMCPRPAPDPDGQPGAARLLNLGSVHADELHCRAGDCADWYRVRVPERGDLVVRVESPVAGLEGRALVFALADGRANQLDRATVSPVDGDGRITWQSSAGYYMVRVESQDEARTPLSYELSFRFEPPPPPPKPPPPPPEPRFEKVKAELLEVEGDLGDPDAVLLDHGEQDGIRRGQLGRLMNGEDTIATIEIVDTYPEGSRARVDALTGPILPETRVEIDVPVEDGP